MVDVGMGKHDGVEMRQAAIPEEFGNRACAGGRLAHPAGVVEHRPARGKLDEHRAAVPHAEKRAIEPVAIVPPSRCPQSPAAIHTASSAMHQRRGGRIRGKATANPKAP